MHLLARSLLARADRLYEHLIWRAYDRVAAVPEKDVEYLRYLCRCVEQLPDQPVPRGTHVRETEEPVGAAYEAGQFNSADGSAWKHRHAPSVIGLYRVVGMPSSSQVALMYATESWSSRSSSGLESEPRWPDPGTFSSSIDIAPV